MIYTRRHWIELIRRAIYNGQPSDDATITEGLVNVYLEPAAAFAAKQNYTENVKLDSIGYVNGSFYTTFKNLVPTQDENFVYKIALPQMPAGIGRNEGVSTLEFKDANNNLSQPCIPISEQQRGYFKGMRPMAGKILYCLQGSDLYAFTTVDLTTYKATVSMISTGDNTDLDSRFNVPMDYLGGMVDWIKNELLFERKMPQDLQNNGVDN